MESKLRIGVIGAGRLGSFHAQKLVAFPEVILSGIADPIRSRRESLAAACGCSSWPDHRPLLERCDAVVIATPTKSHFSVARDCLEAGLHVFIEKPLTSCVAEADKLLEIARKNRRIIQVGHIERFNPAFRAARPFLEEPWLIEAARLGPFSFRSTDVGCVLDMMIHDLDLVLCLVRAPVIKIRGSGIAVLSVHEDFAQVEVEFSTGSRAHLKASRIEQRASRTMRIWSATARVDIDFGARTATVHRFADELLHGELDVSLLSEEELDQLKSTFEPRCLRRIELPLPSGDPLELELREFVEAIREGRTPWVSGEEGREAVALAEAVLEAIDVRHIGWPLQPGVQRYRAAA